MHLTAIFGSQTSTPWNADQMMRPLNKIGGSLSEEERMPSGVYCESQVIRVSQVIILTRVTFSDPVNKSVF